MRWSPSNYIPANIENNNNNNNINKNTCTSFSNVVYVDSNNSEITPTASSNVDVVDIKNSNENDDTSEKKFIPLKSLIQNLKRKV